MSIWWVQGSEKDPDILKSGKRTSGDELCGVDEWNRNKEKEVDKDVEEKWWTEWRRDASIEIKCRNLRGKVYKCSLLDIKDAQTENNEKQECRSQWIMKKSPDKYTPGRTSRRNDSEWTEFDKDGYKRTERGQKGSKKWTKNTGVGRKRAKVDKMWFLVVSKQWPQKNKALHCVCVCVCWTYLCLHRNRTAVCVWVCLHVVCIVFKCRMKLRTHLTCFSSNNNAEQKRGGACVNLH